MNFKTALFISFLSHCFILTPIGNLWFFPQHKRIENPPITYYKLAPPKVEAEKRAPDGKKIPAQTSLRGTARRSRSRTEAIPKVASEAKQSKEIASSSLTSSMSRTPRNDVSHISPAAKPPEVKPQEKLAPPKESVISLSIPGTTLPNTPACIEYNQYIREQIQRSLKQRYTPEYEEGDVNVSFALEQSGGLISMDIIEEKSSSDKELRRLVYEGIRAASPFRPFPNGLLQKQISFNLTVVFKKD